MSLARPLTQSRREARDGVLLVAPTLIVVGAVVVFPFVRSVLFAVQDVRLVDIPRMSTFSADLTWDNFRRVLSSDGFWTSMRTTVVYATLCTVGSVGAGLVVALALRRPFRGRAAIRALVLMPYVLPVVAATTTWGAILNPQYGPVNAFGLRYLGWDAPVDFLSTQSIDVGGVPVPVALSSVVLFEVWKTFPLTFLFITARLQAAPKDLEEAASIDGASPLQSFRHVLAPQLTGVLLLLGLLRFIWSFQNFNDIYLLTGGAGGTEVVAIRVYNELINRQNVGTASAVGFCITIALVGLLAVYVWFSRRESNS